MDTKILDCKDSLVELGDYICFADTRLSSSNLYMGKVVRIKKTSKTVLFTIDLPMYSVERKWKLHEDKCYAICKI
jgi:hypothetical protein